MNEAAHSNPEELQALFNEAIGHYQRGAGGQALTILDRITAQGFTFQGLHYVKALCCATLGYLHRVVPELEKECDFAPAVPDALKLLGQIRDETRGNPTLRDELHSEGRYVVCGLPPGEFGTGKFFAALLPSAVRGGFKAIHPVAGGSLSLLEQIRIAGIRNSNVLILHPQTLRFSTVRSLYENGNRLNMYVLDNSFFCIRSLNHRIDRTGECLDCVGNVDACHASCQPFPSRTSKEENLSFLRWLQSVAPSMHFFCQTNHQAELVHRHFGTTGGTTVIGMRTEEFDLTDGKPRYDVVFHGEALNAKGLRYVVQLARNLPNVSFLIPSDPSEVARELQGEPISPNVHVENLRWETGLKEQIVACRLVLCPSQWSAPVEGALLKSLFYNGNVAVCSSEFGFEREVPQELLLRLNSDLSSSAGYVQQFLDKGVCNREIARRWVDSYKRGVNLDAVFSIASDPPST